MRKVTICIPIHNAALTLSDTLDSLLEQDYPINKIKLFNNASTDSTQEIILKYSGLYPFIEYYQNNLMVSAEDNFTNCILAAEGDFCAIVHSDDVYEKKFISQAIEIFTRHEDCAAVFCHALEINLQGKITGQRYIPASFKKTSLNFLNFNQLLQHSLKFSNFLTCPSAVVRSEVYRDVIKTWKGDEFKTSADLDTWLRISKVGPICFNSAPLMRYRVASTSLSFRMARSRLTKHDIFLVLSKYIKENRDWLPAKSLDDYQFLLIKDTAFRIINSWRNKVSPYQLKDISEFKWNIVFQRFFRSFWHFKMSFGIIFARLLFLLAKRGP